MKFINYFIIMTIYYLRNIFSARITYFQGLNKFTTFLTEIKI